MKEYLITIIAFSLILSFSSFFLPNGKLKNTCEIVISLLFTFSLLKPILNTNKENLSFNISAYSEEISTVFSKNIEKTYEKGIMNKLKENDLICEKVEVSVKNTQIKNIKIYLSNLVLLSEKEHIDYTEIKNYCAKILSIDESIIEIYG